MFSNPEFQDLYEQFTNMFKKEGDVYGTLVESIRNDYKHSVIPSNLQKTVILQILEFASIDYFKDSINIIEEKDIVDEFRFK